MSPGLLIRVAAVAAPVAVDSPGEERQQGSSSSGEDADKALQKDTMLGPEDPPIGAESSQKVRKTQLRQQKFHKQVHKTQLRQQKVHKKVHKTQLRQQKVHKKAHKTQLRQPATAEKF